MATKTTSPAPEKTVQPTPQQVVNDGILKVVAASGIDVQKNRYKAMRAIAWQAFANAIEAGTFNKLVDQAIVNFGALPSGWEIEAPNKVAPKAAPAGKANAR
jgi:hypothetical protein